MDLDLTNYIDCIESVILDTPKVDSLLMSIVDKGKTHYPTSTTKSLLWAARQLRNLWCATATTAAFCNKLENALGLPENSINIELESVLTTQTNQFVYFTLSCASWSKAYSLSLQCGVVDDGRDEDYILNLMLKTYNWSYNFELNSFGEDAWDKLKQVYAAAIKLNSTKGL